MKRTYKENYLTKNPRVLLARATMFAVKNRNKIIVCVLSVVLLLFFVSCLLVVSESHVWPAMAESVRKIKGPRGTRPSPPGLFATSAVLMDSESGRILYEKNAHEKRQIASTTKIITALVVREQLDLMEKVVVSAEATAVGEQEIWLDPGETMTVEELLWAMLVQSANDAAYALAQYSTGSFQSFAHLMNKKAEKIGARESHFSNPHGLDQPDHYSTAYDLALFGRELMKDPVLAQMVGSRTHDLPWPGHPYPRTCVSHNEILGRYPGATGIKTGYTEGAGQCLVASASRDGKSLIAVALNSQHRDSDVTGLFDYGFGGTERVVLVRKGENLGRTRVSAYPRRYARAIPEGELAALSVKGAGDVFRVQTSISREAKGSVNKGTPLGKVDCRLNNHKIYEEKVIATGSVSKSDWLTGILFFLWYSLCWMGRIISAPFRVF